MSKTLKIEIRPVAALAEDFKVAFQSAEERRTAKRKEGVYFTSLEAARRFLTKERLSLLRAIRIHEPRSIYDLAKILKRDTKNVQQDVALLKRHGLVALKERRRGEKSVTRVPQAPYSEISLRIAI